MSTPEGEPENFKNLFHPKGRRMEAIREAWRKKTRHKDGRLSPIRIILTLIDFRNKKS